MSILTYSHRYSSISVFTALLLFITFLVSPFFSLSANAQNTGQYRGLTISPAITEIKAQPNKLYSTTLEVFNDSLEDRNDLYTFVQTFGASNTEGQPEIRDFKDDEPARNWLRFSESTFSLKAGQKKELKIDITIPDGTSASSYFFAAVVGNKSKSADPNTNVILEERLSGLIFLEIQGKADRNVTFQNFKSSTQLVDPFFDSVLLQAQILVKGKSFLRPSGQFKFIQGSDTIAQTDINPKQKIILPNSQRNFDLFIKYDKNQSWAPTWLVNNAGGKPNNIEEFTVSAPFIGFQKIQADLPYINSNGEVQVLQASTDIFFFPYKTLSAILLLVIILYILYFFLIKRNKKVENS